MRAFFNGCSLTAELIDFVSSHLGGSVDAFGASARRRRLGTEGPLDKPADCLGTARAVRLLRAPSVEPLKILGRKARVYRDRVYPRPAAS